MEVIKELRECIEGDILSNSLSKKIYSVDASIYEIEPLLIVCPKTQDALIKTIEIAYKHKVPLIPRGAGTGITGGCLGRGLVVDTSKYLRKISHIDIQSSTVICEPGVIQNQLNDALAPYGFVLGPDTSTGNRATIGGMVGNNSSGSHSIRHGKMVDHVEEVTIALPSGKVIKLNYLTEEEWKNKCLQGDEEGILYQKLDSLIKSYRTTIESDFPKIPRRVSGYNLDTLLKFPRNLSKIFTGSEGTLGTLIEVKLKIVPKPKYTGLVIFHFDNFIDSLKLTKELLPYSLYSLEVIDKLIVEMAKSSPSMRGKMGWLTKEVSTLLIAEFDASTADGVQEKIEECLSKIKVSSTTLIECEEIENVWAMRKAGLGLILSRRSFSRGIAFIEDIAVLPEELHQFMEEFIELLKKHGKTDIGMYGHAGAGCLHLRPFIDLRSDEELQLMRRLMESTAELILKYQGSLSGEHGDGLIRSWLNEKMFGAELYQAFKDVKEAFDPQKLANPGKVVDAPGLFSDLRLHPHSRLKEIPTFLNFEKEGGLSFAMDMCNGNAQCRKREGLMCPSFQITHDEHHSTRGRAQSLRAIVHNKESFDTFTSKELYEVLDLCLECKGCKTECPSQVDIAKVKSEFLYQYQKKHGYSLRSILFGNLSTWNIILSKAPKFSNFMLTSFPNRLLLKKLGVHPKRTLPPLATQTFSKWFKKEFKQKEEGYPVCLFVDTYTEYHCPEVGKSAVKALRHLGYSVIISSVKCCGRPLISKGILEKAKKKLTILANHLLSFAQKQIPLIVLEPSCLSTLQDDLHFILPKHPLCQFSQWCFSLESFLKHKKVKLPQSKTQLHYHVHCHEKALRKESSILTTLSNTQEIPTGCCGMAGSFGYEKEHYELSHNIAQDKLLPYLKNVSKEESIVANGFSCRHQIEDFSNKQAIHFSEWLERALNLH